MRQLIRMLAVASLALCIPTPAESQVGPLTNNVRLDVSKNLQTNQYFSNGPRGGDAYVFVGRQNGTTSYRAFFQWDLPDDLLPDGSTVSQVRLEFQQGRLQGPRDFDPVFYSPILDLAATSDWGGLWNTPSPFV